MRPVSFVGAISANSSLGTQWDRLIESTALSVQAAMPDAPPRPIFKMNLNMTVV